METPPPCLLMSLSSAEIPGFALSGTGYTLHLDRASHIRLADFTVQKGVMADKSTHLR
ncbi:MAG: hypothetical protein JWN52_55 [Actinomycetia bacterium]|nr:hypothetical protein [Actinomycetes bacterium]